MPTILTTLAIIISLGYAIETTTLTVDLSGETELCKEPSGQFPPPPTN
ncbi:MAG: hypothetical protein WCX28_04185 [Bacteriovoracaceae bacterium]|nr:hypothetical protein [Bacteroidota bacterium]